MKKVIEYIAISTTKYDKFIAEVNLLIKDGWQPFGGLTIADVNGAQTEYGQALVKYKEEKNVLE